MQLTTRDKVLLHLLNRHNLLSTKQIQARVFPQLELTTVMRRLRKLQASGFIVRLGMLPCRTLTWGSSLLSNELFTGFASSQRTNLHTLFHDVALSDLRLFFEDLTRVDDWYDLRHIKHDAMPPQFNADYGRDTFDLQNGESELVPDALFVGYKNDQPISCSLELELSVKSTSRYKRLMQRYSYKKHPALILYVVKNDKIRAAVENAAPNCLRPSNMIYTVRLQDLLSCGDNAVLQHATQKTFKRLHELFDCRTRRDVHQPVHLVDKPVGNLLKTAFEGQVAE